MQRVVKVQEKQAVTPEDFNNFGLFPREAFDSLIKDAVEPGLKFTGFGVVESAPAKVTVGAGRLYADGAVFYDATEGGIEVNLIDSLAATARKIIAIVAFGSAVDTDTEPRTFLTNVTTRATQAEVVSTENRRVASIGRITGSESSEPTKPQIPANYLAVAWVTVDTTGIVSIEVAVENRLISSRKNADDIAFLNLWRKLIEPKLTTISTDIGNLAIQVARGANRDMISRIQEDMARVKEQLNLPDDFTDYGGDVFLDDDESYPAYSGYAARIDNGLQFPFAAQTTATMALANPAEPQVTLTNGLILPKYREARIREIANSTGDLALNQFHYDNNSLVVATMKPTRTQHGPAFLVSASSSWWGSGRYLDVSRGLFEKDGQFWTVLPAQKRDPSGAELYRVYSWAYYTAGPGAYWTRNTSAPEVVSGHQWCQTFFNTQDIWLTGINLHFYPTIGSGNVTVAICEVDERAEPNVDKTLAMSTLTSGQLSLGPTKFPMTPTFLEKGKRYGVVIMTAGNHWVTYGDASGYLQGSLFFRNSGGHWETDPSKNIMLDLWVATFDNVRSVVPLQPISLAGGLSSLDITAPMVKPASCELTFEAQVGGVWYALTEDNGSILNNLPELVNLRAVFAGSSELQPGIRLGDSSITASRVATAVKHASSTRTTPVSVNKVTLKVRLERFDGAHNTCTLKIDRAGTIETADLTTNRTLEDGSIERTCVFNLAASTTTFRRVIEGTSDHHSRNFVVSEITDVTDSI